MSESEKRGRCRQQLEAWYANNSSSVPRYSWMVADAIDRLAADVAAVKEITQEIALRVPSEFGRDACDVAVRVLEKERDAAIRERDEARALLKLAQVQRTAAYADRDVARAEVERLKAELDKEKDENRVWVQAVGLCATAVPQPVIDGRGPLGMARQIVAEVARLRGEVEDRDRRMDELIVEKAALARQLDEARAEVERLKESRDAANRLFGAEQAEVERLRKELDDREQTEQVKRLREANETLHRKSLNYIHDRDQYRRERDQERADVERLRMTEAERGAIVNAIACCEDITYGGPADASAAGVLRNYLDCTARPAAS